MARKPHSIPDPAMIADPVVRRVCQSLKGRMDAMAGGGDRLLAEDVASVTFSDLRALSLVGVDDTNGKWRRLAESEVPAFGDGLPDEEYPVGVRWLSVGVDIAAATTAGTYSTGVTVRNGSCILYAVGIVVQAFTNGGGSSTVAVGVHTDDPTGILPATNIAALGVGKIDGTPDWTAANTTAIATAERAIVYTVGGADVLSGSMCMKLLEAWPT